MNGHNQPPAEDREAQRMARQPLPRQQIEAITREQFDLHAWRGTTVLNYEVARAVERAHGIGVET